MKRSEVNALLSEAVALCGRHAVVLPPWAAFRPVDWAERPDQAAFCAARQIGWDITDFGGGDFPRRGLVLLCLRNGIAGRTDERSYAEKLLVVHEDQETPWHFHKEKMEDIIVRGGGTLVIELVNTDAKGTALDTPVRAYIDAEQREVPARTPIRLLPGQSITLPRRLAHRFYGEHGSGTVLVGEVSQVNDDLTDNYFLSPVARFASIEEDVPPLYPLWSEVGG
jgi:D-lyxose ketol-isomerase